jgi:hypothetical protein
MRPKPDIAAVHTPGQPFAENSVNNTSNPGHSLSVNRHEFARFNYP